MIKVEPTLFCDLKSKSPPKDRQMLFEMYKPKPLPVGFILRFSKRLLLKKGVKIIFISDLGIPIPVSPTVISILVFLFISYTSKLIELCGLENLIALLINLSKTCYIRSLSNEKV